VYTKVGVMVSQAKVKMYEVGSRHTINLPSEFVRDSAFPFQPKEELTAKIQDDKVIIEKAVLRKTK
jgi:hypothetical protein